MTPLHFASNRGNVDVEIIRELIQNGADINAKK